MFSVIGERINTSRKKVHEAVVGRNAAYIREDVKKQIEAGANFVDVNAGARIGHEMEDMRWLLKIINEIANVPLCLDSPDPAVQEEAFQMVKNTPMINSISLENERYNAMLPFLSGKDCKVIALCMDDSGMPDSADQVVERASRLVTGLESVGVKRENIYIDPMIQPISTDITKGVMAMVSVRRIMEENPGVHTVCGLSNISYGLPQRKKINRIFLALLMAAGLDGAIVDPLDRKIMATLKTALMLLGKDNYCLGYIKSVRSGQIVA
jgi:5-methyltetrahydrofolate--homocysteine methyltransferase